MIVNSEKVLDVAFCRGKKLFYYIRLKIVFRLCIFSGTSTQKRKQSNRAAFSFLVAMKRTDGALSELRSNS